VRLMKTRHKTFHAQAKLVSYFQQIHLHLLVVYTQQLQEILMYLLLAFKKRPPVKATASESCPSSAWVQSIIVILECHMNGASFLLCNLSGPIAGSNLQDQRNHCGVVSH
jgi:hypothetical protein